MPPVPCPECACPIVAGQRYCLECGSRVAAPVVPWRSAPPAPGAALAPTPVRARVPRPKTAAALLLAALGTGTVLGAAAAPAPTAAGQAAPVIAYAPQAAATATPTPTPTPAPTPDGSALPDDVPPPPAPAPSQPTATPSPPTQTASVDPTPTPTATPEPTPTPDAFTPPVVKHVVIVALTGHHYAPVFGAASPSGYLSHDLPAQGTLLTRYHGVAGDAAANANALMAGVTALADYTPSLPYELGTIGKTWKAYVQGTPAPCTPAPRDPFPRLPMLPDCPTADGPLEALATDFADPDSAPALAYVIPDGCHDGSFTTCPELDGDADGLARADAWLAEWIPKITESPAFADDGLLVVLFDGDRPDADPAKAIHVGAVIVSRFARKGAESHVRYDHLNLLRTLSEVLGVDPPGDAAGDDVEPLGADVFR